MPVAEAVAGRPAPGGDVSGDINGGRSVRSRAVHEPRGPRAAPGAQRGRDAVRRRRAAGRHGGAAAQDLLPQTQGVALTRRRACISSRGLSAASPASTTWVFNGLLGCAAESSSAGQSSPRRAGCRAGRQCLVLLRPPRPSARTH